MGFSTFQLVLVLACLASSVAQNNVEVVFNSTAVLTETDDNYICATIDWWPQNKCNYDQCPWGSSSVINLDLSNPLLAAAVRAFKHLRIRIGGSLQDQVQYNVGILKKPCIPFSKKKNGLFGYSEGCLNMDRWDELNHFFNNTGLLVTFGLNALYGRRHSGHTVWRGDWDSSNARDFIKYTLTKGYQIDSWEFGNELSGKGVDASVGAEQYGKDLINLKALIDELYWDVLSKPLILAPGGFYDKQWYAKLLQVSGPRVINVLTHHIYNLGAGNDPKLVNKILDPNYLSRTADTFRKLKQTIETNGPWSSAWVGESGGAYNSGGRHVSDAFIDSFWYLDQLGMAAKYNTKVYCRQSLIGGNYGLLDTKTFVPNPDYYSALLWHRLMGTGVLDVKNDASQYLRSYAHCSKGIAGVTLLLINFSNDTDFRINVQSNTQIISEVKGKTDNNKPSFIHGFKRAVSWVGRKAASNDKLRREEYHLTPNGGDLRSKTMLLNGRPLEITDNINIPTLEPILPDENVPITISPLSIKFVVLPNFGGPFCR